MSYLETTISKINIWQCFFKGQGERRGQSTRISTNERLRMTFLATVPTALRAMRRCASDEPIYNATTTTHPCICVAGKGGVGGCGRVGSASEWVAKRAKEVQSSKHSNKKRPASQPLRYGRTLAILESDAAQDRFDALRNGHGRISSHFIRLICFRSSCLYPARCCT